MSNWFRMKGFLQFLINLWHFWVKLIKVIQYALKAILTPAQHIPSGIFSWGDIYKLKCWNKSIMTWISSSALYWLYIKCEQLTHFMYSPVAILVIANYGSFSTKKCEPLIHYTHDTGFSSNDIMLCDRLCFWESNMYFCASLHVATYIEFIEMSKFVKKKSKNTMSQFDFVL